MRIGLMIVDLGLRGGGERVLTILANSLANRGHDVILYTFSAGEVYELDGRVTLKVMQHTERGYTWRKVKRALAAREQLRRDDLDAFIAFGHGPALYGAVSLKKDTKVIASERIDPYSEPKSKIERILRNWAFRRADILVCQTDMAKEYYSFGNEVVILNPLTSRLPEREVSVRRKTVVNFCRLAPQKNIPLLLDAFAIFSKTHPDYSLEVYGKGDLKEELQERIKVMGLQDRACIHDFDPALHDKILDAAMYVSSSDYEGLSNSMLEAMAMGLPVICTDCPIGGARMVIEDGVNGLLVPLNDAEKMAEAMTKMADDPDFAEACGKRARLIRDRLSPDVICRQWEALL